MKEIKTSKAWSIASLVTSIIGIILFLAPYIGIIFSIFAIVSSQFQKPKNGMSTAGLVVGILGTLTNLVMLFIVIMMMMLMPVDFWY